MKKYGVEEVSTGKVAEEGEDNLCPKCGSVLEAREETGVKVCLRCGTKPFEVDEIESSTTAEN